MNDAPVEALLAGLAGLLIGSFLNVCIYRLPRDLSIVRPRSHCPVCGKQVRSWDNIPALSYLLLRGKCRDCGERISWRYPAVEAATGIIFYLIVSMTGVTPLSLRNCLFASLMIALVATDFETRLLPESLTFSAIALGLAASFIVPVRDGISHFLFGLNGTAASFGDAVAGGVIPAGGLWVTGWAFEKIRHKQGLGLGDVVMIMGIGTFLGLRRTLLALIAATLAGAVCGMIYIKARGKEAGTYELPLGSFLGISAVFFALYGSIILNWYEATPG